MPETQGDRVLRENLQALSTRNRDLAATVSAATPDPRFTAAPSRSGSMVPAVKSAAGTTPLHSQYDPRAEARRLMDAGHASRGADGFLALFGLGGGFLAEAALEDSSTWHVLVVEKDPSVLLTLLTHVPLGRLLADPRVTVVCGLPGIRPALLSNWKPALMGGMKVVPLRPWCEQERPFFDRAAAEVSAAVDAVRSDYSVQSHFGKRWFANMLANLPRVRTPSSPSAVAAAVVTAAGPSLEQHTAALAGRGKDVLVVATDTSLPALLRAGVEPDAVLSIDCQIYGYHHFMQGLPPTTALYLDLSSPPQLARRFPRARFVAGGHPFARYVDAHWMHLPVVDTSGGNVTHAAVTLARGLGAERITVRGADFSYPDAKPYARGTYLYDVFQAVQDRFSPADSELVSLAVRNAARETRAGKTVYTTVLLSAYRRRFEELMAGIDSLPAAHLQRWPPAPNVPRSWRDFLAGYAAGLQALPAPTPTTGMEELWGTILPVAASVVKERTAPGPAALQEARRWSLERIRRAVAGPDPDAQA